MIVDELKNWGRYPFGDAWVKAFEHILSLTPASAVGDVPLIGEEMYARVLRYDTKTIEEAKLEAHQRYVDIQATIVGAEALEWFPTRTLTPKTGYDATKDVTFFHRPGEPKMRVDVATGMFVVLFPDDAHIPALQVAGVRETITKVVVKVGVHLLKSR